MEEEQLQQKTVKDWFQNNRDETRRKLENRRERNRKFEGSVGLKKALTSRALTFKPDRFSELAKPKETIVGNVEHSTDFRGLMLGQNPRPDLAKSINSLKLPRAWSNKELLYRRPLTEIEKLLKDREKTEVADSM
jgi:hypothetical protein